MRKPYLAGNWKMNLDRQAALALVRALRDHVGDRTDRDVAVAPPFVYIDEVARAVAGSAVKVGGQNMCDEPSGAFTGEISAAMLLDVGASFVILGHSERRHVYGEGDDLVNRKVLAALDAGLEVILCCGETLAEREDGLTEQVVQRHLVEGLRDVAVADQTLGDRLGERCERTLCLGLARSHVTRHRVDDLCLVHCLSRLFTDPSAAEC